MIKKILKWYYGCADLKKKLMVAYGMVVLLPVLIFGINSYHSSYKNFFEHTKLSMEDAASSMKAGLENSISRENDNLGSFTSNVNIQDSSKSVGIMEMELALERVMEPVRQVDGKNSGIFLLDHDGNIIYKTTYNDEKTGREVEAFILQNAPQEFVVKDSFLITGEKRLSNGWKLYYFLDRTFIDRHLGEIQLTTITMMAVSFGFVMLLGNIISTILGNRLLRLKEAAEEISRGNFNVELDLRYSDELGNLSKSFDRMQRQMNKMMEEMYHLGMEKRKVELTALQAKINPHFLYNCLSAIKWEAIKKGEDDIAEITGLLAKFYRSNLNEGKALTTVENELETIRTYLEIQKNTHEGSFDVEFYLDEDGRDIRMPHFLLQPIVENSIVHGVDTIPDGKRGKIVVIYRKEEEYLVFEIKNNTAATDAFGIEDNSEKPATGYGLYNIQERIRLYYDDIKCGIRRTMVEDGMVSFTVRIGAKLKNVDLEQDAGLINR